MMTRFSRGAWAASVVALGGCTTLLGVDQDYQLGSTTTPGGSAAATTAGASGTGGGGGTGGQVGTVTSSTTGQGGASSTTSSGTGTPCDPTYTCVEAMTPPHGDPTKLCDGLSATAYNAYHTCTCKPGGTCYWACGESFCVTQAQTAECTTCFQDSAVTGCGKAVDNCANN